MATVEIRITTADVPQRMEAMRQWLDTRGIKPVRFISTGSSNETLVIVEFASGADGEAFAKQFEGSVVQA
jgi:hypothetical protein